MFTLIAVLSKLTALTSFVFEARNHDSRWMNIPKELRMAICTLCERSSLVNLGLLNLRTFAELDEFAALVAAPTLSDISFRSIELPTVAETESAAHTQLRPTRCSLRLAHPTLSIMMRWLADGDVSQLQHLEVNWAPGMTDHLQRLMDDSAQSLEKLWLIADHSPSSYAPHNLIFPAKLCHLHLTFSLHVSETDTMTPWIANVLEPSHGPSHLITIVVQISLRRPLHPLAPIPPIDWAPLASILTAAQFPVLRSLLLEIKALGSDAQLKVVAEEARKALRDLDVRGILTCQATSWRVLRRSLASVGLIAEYDLTAPLYRVI
ncbi:hypothetical protein FB451DRAFT_1409561 [Mycena latifolia]|nr:hypothetical protein FB451DRAFT_1409561 [Mycena latifolia]